MEHQIITTIEFEIRHLTCSATTRSVIQLILEALKIVLISFVSKKCNVPGKRTICLAEFSQTQRQNGNS